VDTEQCLACGGELPEFLAKACSLRCNDCRDAHAELDPALCDEQETEAHRAA
jgi:hypothetical protein